MMQFAATVAASYSNLTLTGAQWGVAAATNSIMLKSMTVEVIHAANNG